MKIQSLSLVVPTNKCINSCPFCVSRLHNNSYKITDNLEQELKERLQYSKEIGVNTIIITGTGEPLQNIPYLKLFSKINKSLLSSFHNIELQTTGVYLNDDTLKMLKYEIGVKTISLSVSDFFNNKNNLKIIGVKKDLYFDLKELIKKIKSFNFNIRISLNMLNNLENKSPDYIFDKLITLGIDQVTFREMYYTKDKNGINKWIKENKIDNNKINDIKNYIKYNGKKLRILPFNAIQYSVNGISTVVDDDCMNTKLKEDIKYLILRENGKLYFKWDDKGSLIF